MHLPLLNAISDPVLIKDMDGSIIDLNDAAIRLLNQSKKAVINKTIFDFFPLEMADQVDQQTKNVLISRKSIAFEAECLWESIKRKFSINCSLLEQTNEDPLIVTMIRCVSIGSHFIVEQTDSESSQENFVVETQHQKNSDNNMMGVAIVDTSLNFVIANPPFCDMLGYTAGELSKIGLKKILLSENVERCMKIKNRLARKEIKAITFEHQFVTKEKRSIPFSTTASGVFDEENQMIACILSLKEIEKDHNSGYLPFYNKQWFQTILDTNLLGITIASEDTKLVQVNDTFSKMTGYSAEELIGKSFLDLTFPEDKDMHQENFYKLKSGERAWIKFEIRYIKKEGRPFWIKFWGKKFMDKGQTFILATFEDLTNEKMVNKYLLEKNNELQRYIDSNSQLENFAYMASHDLKEPLRTICNFTQILEKKYKDKLDADAKEYIGFIVDNVKRMDQLVESLLSYSRVTKNNRLIEPVNLSNLLEVVQLHLRKRIEETSVILRIGELPQTILANKIQLSQVFQNLISNAIKFRNTTIPAVIEIKGIELKDDWQFSVADNGIGIHPDFHEKIFELFRKLHTWQKYEGTGIGLALCHKIIEQHSGRIWVESIEDKGATFFFTIKKK